MAAGEGHKTSTAPTELPRLRSARRRALSTMSGPHLGRWHCRRDLATILFPTADTAELLAESMT